MSRSKAWCAVVVTAILASFTLPVRAQTTWSVDENSTDPTHNRSSDGRILVPSEFGGDCDDDGDIDLDDWVVLLTSLTGPGVVLAPGSECSDLDGDGDVDIVDVTVFASMFTGGTLRSDRVTSQSEVNIFSEVNIVVLANGSTSITVTPAAEVTYEVGAELSDSPNEGLAFIGFDVEFDGGDLRQAHTPTGPPMSNFVIPEGVTNPAGFGGTTGVPGREGDLVQVAGGQNTIRNVEDRLPTQSVR